MKKIILPCLFSLILLSCEKEDHIVHHYAPKPLPEEVNIRIINSTDHAFQSVYVNSLGGENFYGDIPSGDSTAYAHYWFAYRFATVELLINHDTLRLEPINYVGEQTLKEGSYTYQLDLIHSPQGDSVLTLELIKDN